MSILQVAHLCLSKCLGPVQFRICILYTLKFGTYSPAISLYPGNATKFFLFTAVSAYLLKNTSIHEESSPGKHLETWTIVVVLFSSYQVHSTHP